ncbi:DNA helicase related protein [Lunatimonas lonarensis]|uniref:DNA helicase related protein n=1 Tax=Lunatimonas lonarensis TaxID=1232681 RepID=R7ZSB6_9BACT|nr:AAA domain-containing protein [Lunatimonas lonarensis]EON76943.1 DNA helicase related protein [Lunatimonas lonarensis]
MLQDIFQVYKNRLVDLSSNNRSIFLPKLVQQQMIDLKDFHFLNNHPAFYYITELLGRKRRIPLIQGIDARDKNVNVLSQKLKRLFHQVRFLEEESGERSLFVGWPFVEGKFSNGQLVRCPLIFFPVTLVLEDNVWYMQKHIGEQPFINPSFLLAYGQAEGKVMDKDWLDQPLEDFSKDPRGFRTDLYHHLHKQLVLNFNREIYQDRLEIFPEESRSYFDGIFHTGLLKLQPYAVLGQFSQKSSFLMDDYAFLIAETAHLNLDDLFADRFGRDEGTSHVVREDTTYNTLPLDASQERVLTAVKQGESCVVQGPPGTGKSQLICNLVADFTSRGKKVLVVSQKRAALDVVYSRLAEQGFSSFSALVHDFRGDRKGLYKKIAHQIGSLENYRELNRSINAIQLERSFGQHARTIEKYRDFFNEYRDALYDIVECGVPIKELYMQAVPNRQTVSLGSSFRSFTFDDLADFFYAFRVVYPNYRKYDYHSSFWFHRLDFSGFALADLGRFEYTMKEIAEVKRSAEKDLFELLGEQFDFSLIYQSFEQRERLGELLQLVESQPVFDRLRHMVDYPKTDFDLLWLENKADTVHKLFQHEGIEWHTRDEDVEGVLRKAIQLEALMGTWWGRIQIRIERKKFWDILSLLELNDLKTNREGIRVLVSRLESRLNLNHQYTLLQQKPWMNLPRKPFEEDAFDSEIDLTMQAVKARFALADLGVLTSHIYHAKASYGRFYSTLKELVRLNEWGLRQVPKWRACFSDVQLKHLLGTPDQDRIQPLLRTLRQDVESLIRYDTLKTQLPHDQFELMKKLVDSFPDHSLDELELVFVDSLRLAWIDHIETKFPVLKEIQGPQVKGAIEAFQQAVEEKDKIAKFIVELRLREEVCRELEYNRLNNLITYRDLNHQVTKKKSVWPVKRLVESYHEELFKLLPCWLTSPETASAIFPMKAYFDLVIFDEASQCYFERALPAMLRGRQVVVAGDRMQLQPIDLYKVRLESEEDVPELKLDSLLEMAERYFPVHWLTTHYRSRYLPLIHFSNREFYDDKLAMIPDMESLNMPFAPFRLVRCQGIWQNQRNRIEAEEVIVQVRSLLLENPSDRIGVITFNYFQMVLILELLEENQLLDERVSVRNIENVQGDEFDHVVFSVGYAENASGYFTANFGLLARQGGENRLNVAITRAKKQVVLITSIGAGDFRDSHLTNRGIRLLRDYLLFVETYCRTGEVTITPVESPRFSADWALKDRLKGIYGSHLAQENNYPKVMDLEIMENGRVQAAVLTDDQRFFDATGSKESLVYHPRLLRAKNWNLIFLFSRQYWMDREDMLQTKLSAK